jgi:hypothetical protein
MAGMEKERALKAGICTDAFDGRGFERKRLPLLVEERSP